MRYVPVGLLSLLASGVALAAPPVPDPLIEVRGDVDGKPGDETIRLARDGTLTAGTATIAVQLDASDPAFDDQRRLEVISLGGKRRGVMLVTPAEGSEDPPDRYRVFLYRGGVLKLVFDQVVEVNAPLTFSATGTGRYIESGWTACQRASKQHPNAKTAKLYAVSLKLDVAGTKLVTTRALSGQVQKCDELAACPFVYEIQDGEPAFVGEILRDLRGERAYALQSLTMRTRTAGTMRIRISEEKPEVTYLDELYVEVDGTRIAPRACALVPAPAYCVADGRYFTMAYGDAFDVELDVPAGTRTVFARGYYIPN